MKSVRPFLPRRSVEFVMPFEDLLNNNMSHFGVFWRCYLQMMHQTWCSQKAKCLGSPQHVIFGVFCCSLKLHRGRHAESLVHFRAEFLLLLLVCKYGNQTKESKEDQEIRTRSSSSCGDKNLISAFRSNKRGNRERQNQTEGKRGC